MRVCAAVARQPQIIAADFGGRAGGQIGGQLARAQRHGPAQRAVAGVEEKIIEAGGTHNRRAVGRHRAQAAPKSGLCGVAAVGIQIVEHQFERFPPLRIQLDLIARQFGHAAHADAFIKAGDGHFIGFIEMVDTGAAASLTTGTVSE